MEKRRVSAEHDNSNKREEILEGSTQAIKNQQIHARKNLFSRKKYQSLIFGYKIRLIYLIHNTLSRMRLL